MKNQFKQLVAVIVFAVVFAVVMPTHTEAITNLKQKTAKKNSATITWKKSAGEASYRVEFEKSDKVWVSAGVLDESEGEFVYKKNKKIVSKSLKKTSYKCTGLQAGRVYKVKVRAYDAGGREIKSAVKSIKIKTLVGKTEVDAAYFSEVLVEGEEKSETLSNSYAGSVTFIPQDSADGYQIRIYDGKGKMIGNRTTTKSRMKKFHSELKKKVGVFYMYGLGNVYFPSNVTDLPMYKVQIRAYQKYKGKKVYGAWGTGYGLKQPVGAIRKNSDGSVDFKWTKNTAATGYDLYLSSKKSVFECYTKWKTLEKYRVSSFGKNETETSLSDAYFEKGKTYYYVVVAKKKVGKKVFKSEIDMHLIQTFTY